MTTAVCSCRGSCRTMLAPIPWCDLFCFFSLFHDFLFWGCRVSTLLTLIHFFRLPIYPVPPFPLVCPTRILSSLSLPLPRPIPSLPTRAPCRSSLLRFSHFHSLHRCASAPRFALLLTQPNVTHYAFYLRAPMTASWVSDRASCCPSRPHRRTGTARCSRSSPT